MNTMGTIASRQAAIEFTRAHERDGCHNCKHGQRLPLLPQQRYASLECGRFGFFVRVADTCMHYAIVPALPAVEGGNP